MAINNWRYIVTWWYMDPNGDIVEERQYIQPTTPNVTPTTSSSIHFPNAEAYWLQSQWYASMWDNAMANAYGWLANDLWRYSTFANTSVDTADALLNYLRQNEAWLQRVAWQTYNTLVGDIQNQRDYINKMFGPEWELTREVNQYYDDLGNYLSTEAWRQAANIAAQWVHSWASLWAIRAQQNEAYNEAFGRYVQAKEQEINAKQQIAANLINYMSTLRQEYWNTTNQYIIDLYKRANDMYNNVAQSVASDIDQYNMLRAQGTWWSWASSYNDIINSLLGSASTGEGATPTSGGITTPANQWGATTQWGGVTQWAASNNNRGTNRGNVIRASLSPVTYLWARAGQYWLNNLDRMLNW